MLKRVLVAPNAFKETLTSQEVSEAIVQGFRESFPQWEYDICLVADGGDGSLEAVNATLEDKEGHWLSQTVQGPMGEPVNARWLKVKEQAYIEISEAAGLKLVPQEHRNPMKASSYGVGELILAALEENCKDIHIFLGGSATVDGGMGALEALGVKFFDKNHEILVGNGQNLIHIHHIETSSLKLLRPVRFTIIGDVTNPLLGEKGAVFTYGKQKGALESMITPLEKGLSHWALCLDNVFHCPDPNQVGSGAAGGMGFGLKVALQANFILGADFFSHSLNLEDRVKNSDIVITGEGQLDQQTQYDKMPQRLISLANQWGKPVILICGQNRLGHVEGESSAIIFDTLPYLFDGNDWKEQATLWVMRTAQQIAKCIGIT